MEYNETENEFKAFLIKNNQKLESLDPMTGIELMINFYIEYKMEDIHDWDSLLFQYGVHDFGKGIWFEYDITREFAIKMDLDMDDVLFQLSLTFYYHPTEVLQNLKHVSKYCGLESETENFKQFILECEGTNLIKNLKKTKIRLLFVDAE